MTWPPTFLRRATITSSADKPSKAISACTRAGHQFQAFKIFSASSLTGIFYRGWAALLNERHNTMLVNQALCRIQPEPTLLRDPSNRRIAVDWNTPQKSIERQFAQAQKAWVRYQSTRQRDAVYGYLSAVFQAVQRWAMLGHTRTCSLHALTAANRRGAIRTRDPFASLFFCTSDPQCGGCPDQEPMGQSNAISGAL
jgi:hypothetical protein